MCLKTEKNGTVFCQTLSLYTLRDAVKSVVYCNADRQATKYNEADVDQHLDL